MNHLGTQTLETDRLILRRYRMSDAEDMFSNWVTDSEVTRFWGWEPHTDIEETRALLSGWIQEYEKRDSYHWVLELKQTGKAIGYIYFNEIDESDSSAAVHYLISRNHWNQGLMTEACLRVIRFAFDELGARRIRSRHHILNAASGRVLIKCGFRVTHEGIQTFEDCERISGVYRFYIIDKPERP